MNAALTIPQETLVTAIEAVIRQRIADGSRTFLAGSVAKECCDLGTHVTGADVGRYFHNNQHLFRKLKMSKRSWRWQLSGDPLRWGSLHDCDL